MLILLIVVAIAGVVVLSIAAESNARIARLEQEIEIQRSDDSFHLPEGDDDRLKAAIEKLREVQAKGRRAAPGELERATLEWNAERGAVLVKNGLVSTVPPRLDRR